MRKNTQLLAMGVVAIAILVAGPAAAGRGTTFTPIGLFPFCDDVPEGEFCEDFPLTTAVDISPDGSTVVGMHAFFEGNYIWTAESGLNTLGPVAGAPWFFDGGGNVASTPYVAPNFDFNQSGVWTGGFYPNQTWDLIPTAPGYAACGGSGQSVHGAGNGDYITGLTWIDEDGNGEGCEGASGFLWDGTNITVLDNSVNDDSTRGNAVSEDGSVVVGWMQTSSREASKWVDGVQDFICPNPTGAGGDIFCTEGWDVTPDGELMLTSGIDLNEGFTARAQIVDQAGNMQQLPFPEGVILSPDDTFTPRAISDDGNTVVGQYGGSGFFGTPPYPVFWKRGLDKTIDLQIFLIGQGLDDLFFWFLEDAGAVSANGNVIAGQGTNPDQWLEAYVVDINRVKVCHKPEGTSNGSHRTIAIGWDGVADHLNHGDLLSTCEFAGGAGSRAVDALMELRTPTLRPEQDSRVAPQSAPRQRGLLGDRYEGATMEWTPVDSDSHPAADRRTGQLKSRSE